MLANVMKITCVALFFPLFLIANVLWPNYFEARYYDPPHVGGVYGCIGNNDFHDLKLDFVKKTYTKIDMFCRGGEIYFYGSKGYLVLENDKAIKVKTEFAYDAPSMQNMPWLPIEPVSDGNFTYISEHNFDEFDDKGNFLVHW